MISAIIVDDEPINISNLQALLTRYCKEIEVVASATHVDQARELIVKLKPDVVFLNIKKNRKN